MGGASAQAAEQVSATKTAERSCHQRYRGATKSTDVTRTTAPAAGLVQARLSGKGDWDLAVFDAKTRRYVAGSAGVRAPTSSPRASSARARRSRAGLPLPRRAATRASCPIVAVDAARERVGAGEPSQVVEVEHAEQRRQAAPAGASASTSPSTAAPDCIEVVLHGAADARKLATPAFAYTVEIADLAARAAARTARADRRSQPRTRRSALPSGRTTYRRLADYEARDEAARPAVPGAGPPLTLPHKTLEGRDVHGIEITRNAADVDDGKPIFLNMGVHHAREWPASEHSMEFAYDLLTQLRRDAHDRAWSTPTRTIVVPIVNPDGFNISREAPATRRSDFSTLRLRDEAQELRLSDRAGALPRRHLRDNRAGRLRGTDPNRNYGGFWGGPGASPIWSSDTYRGDAPFSEPEVQNIRELQSRRGRSRT